MKVTVDEELCVGCGACVDICPEVFDLEDDMAKVLTDEVPGDLEASAAEAAEACPVDAIIIKEE
ncbi:MAG: ferredoxin [Planctomycetia bacterium]|nr:ferredoxin [Planctomycetia bacterium]